VICFDEVFRGTIDGASVHPREVVKLALARNAAAVILAHNHPSGVAEPSQADELITGRLRDALALVDIRVLDHIVWATGVRVVCGAGAAMTRLSLVKRGLPMSTIVNVHEAKTHLSRLLDAVAAGAEVVIAKAGKPVARLVPVAACPKPKKLGLL